MDDERLLKNKFFKNRKWHIYIYIYLCVRVYSIGKKELKLQLSNNKDIRLTFIYEITSSCVLASSFAVLNIIFSAPLSNKIVGLK